MRISLTPTPNGTTRLVIDEIPFAVVSTAAMDALKFGLNHLCCWGGLDKSEPDMARKVQMYSWEFAPEHGPSAFTLAKNSLERSFPHEPLTVLE